MLKFKYLKYLEINIGKYHNDCNSINMKYKYIKSLINKIQLIYKEKQTIEEENVQKTLNYISLKK